jgi:hypothetical protein
MIDEHGFLDTYEFHLPEGIKLPYEKVLSRFTTFISLKQTPSRELSKSGHRILHDREIKYLRSEPIFHIHINSDKYVKQLLRYQRSMYQCE